MVKAQIHLCITIQHAEQTNGNKYKQNFTLFQNFADSCLQNEPCFLISRIRASHWKNTPLFAKMGTSVVYVFTGCERQIALRNYQNTAYSSRRTINLLQNDNDLTNVPHKILFHGTWCNICNIFASLYDSKIRKTLFWVQAIQTNS